MDKHLEGRLWFDNQVEKNLTERLEPAVARYYERMGHWPNTVYVNPKTNRENWASVGPFPMESGERESAMKLVETEGIAINHFFLTTEEEA